MAIPLSNDCLRAASAELSRRGIAFTVEQGRKHPSIRFQVNGIELRKPFAGSSSCQSAPHKAAADIRRLIRNAEAKQEPSMTGDIVAMPEISLVERAGDPMARDLDVAERLGFEQPREIRRLIARHSNALSEFGGLTQADATVGKGQKVSEYWLNEEQALYIAAVSQAPNAHAVRVMLIKVFVAWRRGHLPAPVDAKQLGGIIKSVVVKQTEDLRAGMELALEGVQNLQNQFREMLPGQPDLTIARDYWLSVQIAEKAGFKEGDRVRGLTQFITRELHRHCAVQGVPVRLEEAVGRPARYLFPVPVATAWLAGCGTARIRHFVERVRAKKSGQGTLALIHRR